MTILYLLIPLAVILMVVAIGFFLWTVRSGQYEDMEGPAHRILMDDDDPMIPANARIAKNKKAPHPRPQEETGDNDTPDASAAGDGSANGSEIKP